MKYYLYFCLFIFLFFPKELPANYQSITDNNNNNNNNNEGRYKAGRLVVPVGSTVIPLVGQVGKISKVKTVLKGIKDLTESQLDELVEKLGKAGKVNKIISSTGEIIYPSIKINGIPVVRILTGNNDKIAIIGRKMPYVRQVAEDLRTLGKEVEIFEPNSAFDGLGYNNYQEILNDFNTIKSQYPNEIIPYDKLKTTLWYQENQRWAKWIKEQGYDIYDLGDNPGSFINSQDRLNVPDASAFYDMEKLEIFNSN